MRWTRGWLPVLALSVAPAAASLVSCQAGYVLRQGLGQVEILEQRVPVDSDAARASLSPRERAALEQVPAILEFARSELGLEPGDAYTTLVDTSGAPISTVVVASHPTSLSPYLWCFPFVGCVPYKGFFDEEDAQREARELRRQGWDVAVLPVEAYSTLGWFSDPILSTMLDDGLPAFVELIIHETVHRTVYFPGQTTINESLATHVARKGTELFFERHPGLATPLERDAYRRRSMRRDLDQNLLERLRRDLDALYASELGEDAKLSRKREIFRTAEKARSRLHGSASPIPASNAFVLANADYHGAIPALEELERELGGQPSRLMAYFKACRDSNETITQENFTDVQFTEEKFTEEKLRKR